MQTKEKFLWIPNHPEYAWWPGLHSSLIHLNMKKGRVLTEETQDFYNVADDKGQVFQIDKSSALKVDFTCLSISLSLSSSLTVLRWSFRSSFP